MSDNLRIWNVLGKTDPAHTKQFTRAGGFKGTAIKPMWANKQMTEMFGPCGIGWGMTEPQFNLVLAATEVMVYCTAGIWYMDDGVKQGPVYGVGGDKVVTQIFLKDSHGQKIVDEAKGGYKTYPQTDDEAYKKSYTDALSNAMKFIGVAADVHMGMFDDNKYVQAMKEEFREEVETEIAKQKAAPAAVPTELDWHYNPSSGVLICRIMDAKLSQKKKGDGELVTVKFNNAIEGKNVAFYFHTTHRTELLGAVGKVAKMIVEKKGEFVNIAAVMEVDGVKVGADSTEADARKLAGVLEFTDGDLMELKDRFCNGDWAETLTKLKAEQERRLTA